MPVVVCSASVHIRCAGGVQLPCAQHSRDDSHLGMFCFLLYKIFSYATDKVPSVFGRDLIEQVQNDGRGDDRQVPIIVEKCIQAVEATGMIDVPFNCQNQANILCKHWNMKVSIARLAV